jgi:hypothetical protein
MTPNTSARSAGQAEPDECRLPPAATPAIDWRALSTAEHACCCSAKPAVVVVMPATAGRDHLTDLLLCGHHYRAARAALAAAGAMAFDRSGQPAAAMVPASR